MEPWILILIVVGLAAVAFFAMRKKPALPAPPEEREEPKAFPARTAKDELEAAAPKKAEPTPEPEKARVEAPLEKAEPAPEKKAEPEPEKAIEAPAPAPTRMASEPPPALAPLEPAAVAPRISIAPKAPAAEDADALRKGLGATRGGFFARLKELFVRKPELDPAALDEVEEILLTSDVGVATTQTLLTLLRSKHEAGELRTSDSLQAALRDEAKRILAGDARGISVANKPSVLLFVGVNGVGKTTTIGKLASKLKEDGKRVLLAAGDTYRAAAVIQLEAWSRRVGCDVVKGKDRADPSAVIFDAVKKGIDEGYDVILCDTAGRLQTKTPLMDELGKIGRSVEKALGRSADETLLVLDATTGQNAIQQAKQFGSTLPLSGIVLTKLDGTAKGGVILGIVDEQKVPVRYVGIGERVEDLRVFDAESFVEALFDPREAE